jgi:hypothetical protein
MPTRVPTKKVSKTQIPKSKSGSGKAISNASASGSDIESVALKSNFTNKSTNDESLAPLGDAEAALIASASNLQAEKEGKKVTQQALLGPNDLRIFQIYYADWQRDLLDANFVPLDNSRQSSELMEFAVFERLAKSEHIKNLQLWGSLSWRFAERAGMSGADFIKAISAQPGKDIYFCNPVPVNEALFHNYWLQGETSHPKFFALCQAIFKVTGLPESELTGLQSSDQFSASNYFVGTSRFWQTYIPWVNQVLSAANKKLPPNVRDLMHSKMADDRDLHKGATYVPFIVERLLPVFLKTAGKGLSAHKIALPKRDAELNVHLKLLREMKDVAHRTKSAWLAACWVNYRNLYLMQVNGKEWCDKHLRNITPTEITFS